MYLDFTNHALVNCLLLSYTKTLQEVPDIKYISAYYVIIMCQTVNDMAGYLSLLGQVLYTAENEE